MPTIITASFGKTPTGRASIYTISNSNGLTVKITNYGATITSIIVPDRAGKPIDIALGFDNIDAYLHEHPHFGGVIGRYCNRIGSAKFSIDGTKYQLANNDDGNNLHGGPQGFDRFLYEAETFETEDTAGVILSRVSPHMESGFPGNLYYKVYYTLNNENELIITYEASTDQTTHVNLTNHTYFNLRGECGGNVLDTKLKIFASNITPVDGQLIPTGELLPVAGTPFDFLQSKTIGRDIQLFDEQLERGNGYDHNFVLDNMIDTLELAAIAYNEESGILLEVETTEPGMQLYTANWLDGSLIGKSGHPYHKRHAFCLETQHYPNSPNNDEFPPTILKKGEEYQSQTLYRFAVK